MTPDLPALGAFLSEWAARAYPDPAALEASVTQSGGACFKPFRRFGAAGFGFVKNGHAWLVFRGTRNAGELVFPDLIFLPWSWPLRHLGFHIYWRWLEPQIVEWLETLPVEVRQTGLITSGHSLGGALAILGAHELAPRYPVHAVVTFGAPRVGQLSFRRSYARRSSVTSSLDDVTMRFTHRTDGVSRIPPSVLLYRHVGVERAVHDDGTLAEPTPSLAERIIGWWNRRIASMVSEADRVKLRDDAAVRAHLAALARHGRPLTRFEVVLDNWSAVFNFLPLVLLALQPLPVVAVYAATLAVLTAIAWHDLRQHPIRSYVEAFKQRDKV